MEKMENEMETGLVGVYEVSIRVIYWVAVKELKLSCKNGCIYIYIDSEWGIGFRI